MYVNSPAQSTFTSSNDKKSPIGQIHEQDMIVESKVNFTQVMLERWVKANQCLPECDKTDFLADNIFINDGVINKHSRQHDPEFSQTSYLRMRSIEEAFPTKDYFSSDFKFVQSNQPQLKLKEQITQFDRSFAIQKIFDLHLKKDYKVETLFTACTIFDRYLSAIDWRSYNRNKICRLAVISILIGAKIEQPVSPNFNKMIDLLSD